MSDKFGVRKGGHNAAVERPAPPEAISIGLSFDSKPAMDGLEALRLKLIDVRIEAERAARALQSLSARQA